MSAGILVFGGTRGTGLEVAKLLAGRGEQVTAMVREESDAQALETIGVEIVRGDVRERGDVERAFGSGTFRATINSVGGKRGETPRPDVPGTQNIVDVAKENGVSRALLVTAIGSGDSRAAVAPKVLEVLGEVLEQKSIAEDYLMQSDLDATILRPGGMTSDPAAGTAIKTGDHGVMGVINRADLAALVIECLDDDSTIGRIYHTIDPEIKWQAPLQRGEDNPGSKY